MLRKEGASGGKGEGGGKRGKERRPMGVSAPATATASASQSPTPKTGLQVKREGTSHPSPTLDRVNLFPLFTRRSTTTPSITSKLVLPRSPDTY